MKARSTQSRQEDLFSVNKVEIDKTNIYLLRRFVFCTVVNMVALSLVGPFMEGFRASEMLYVISGVLSALFGIYCVTRLDAHPGQVLVLFYLFMAGMCAYGVALSAFYYPDIHGVTIVALYMLLPVVILDRSWRVNGMMMCYYLIGCVITVWRKPSALAVDDCLTCGYFMVFGMMIGSYMRTARLNSIERQRQLLIQHRQLELQRSMDELTALPNRRSLFEALAEDEQSEQGTAITGMIMLDIDDFKGYNDLYGHQAGDDCLRAIGAVLNQFSETNFVRVYRYGGEEFLALSGAQSEEYLSAQAENIVKSASGLALGDKQITISAGFAYRGADTTVSTEKLISMADTALYTAKDAGRNCARGYQKGQRMILSETLRKR